MKSLLRLIRSLWFVALLVLFDFGLATSTSGMTASAIAYDGQTQPTIVYDAHSPLVFGYDVAPAPAANEKGSRVAETSGVFSGFAKFVAAETVAPRINVLPSSGNRFVVSPGGDAIIVPRGASGPVPIINQGGRTTGFGYTGGSGGLGLDPRVSNVRIMDATLPRGPSPGYPAGYVNYQNIGGQSVNPFTGQTIAPNNPLWHIPLTPP